MFPLGGLVFLFNKRIIPAPGPVSVPVKVGVGIDLPLQVLSLHEKVKPRNAKIAALEILFPLKRS